MCSKNTDAVCMRKLLDLKIELTVFISIYHVYNTISRISFLYVLIKSGVKTL